MELENPRIIKSQKFVRYWKLILMNLCKKTSAGSQPTKATAHTCPTLKEVFKGIFIIPQNQTSFKSL